MISYSLIIGIGTWTKEPPPLSGGGLSGSIRPGIPPPPPLQTSSIVIIIVPNARNRINIKLIIITILLNEATHQSSQTRPIDFDWSPEHVLFIFVNDYPNLVTLLFCCLFKKALFVSTAKKKWFYLKILKRKWAKPTKMTTVTFLFKLEFL